MSRGKPINGERKAAVLAALMTGQSVTEVAKEYNIPRTTVQGWASASEGVVKVRQEKKEHLGDLLISYVQTSLETLQKQVKIFADEKWLKEQTASEVAVLHGVIADKTIRLLEALAGPEENETT